MSQSIKRAVLRALPLADLLLCPLVYPAAWLLKLTRRAGVHRLPACKRALLHVGVFPLRDHYYEPRFDYRGLPLTQERSLPGIDWNPGGQMAFLDRLVYAHELADLPSGPAAPGVFSLTNDNFGAGDAEYWYQLIRAVRPRRIVEIGSGHSTLMAIRAVNANRADDPGHVCRHLCIEPYEMPWLERSGIGVLRQRVETVDRGIFTDLRAGDILFIDSSHVIRPQGDVLCEYLEILPLLAPGVIVHIHDIFSPRDYPDIWLRQETRFWNEQYLLEAFLTQNREWEILGALNKLHHEHPEKLKAVAPHLRPDGEPGSFYLRRKAPTGV